MGIRKAAVVIGVDRPGKYSPLKAAAAGAEEVAEWFKREGYDVSCLTDRSGPVSAQDAKREIRKYVTQPATYHLLVVYFSGHGEFHARADRWLFSGAPIDTDDAINLDGAMDLAKYSGIRNVVFISDACRSIPDTRAGNLVEGIDAFPNFENVSDSTKIDYFKATSESLPAYEGVIEGKPQGFLTYALKSAFVEPQPDMVRSLQEDNITVRVVPNRKLEDYLQAKVNEIIASVPGVQFQRLDVNVPSNDDVYISKVLDQARFALSAPVPPVGPPPTIGDTAGDAIARTLNEQSFGEQYPDEHEDLVLRHAADMVRSRVHGMFDARLPDLKYDHFESMCGFILRGARIIRAVCAGGASNTSVEVLEKGDGSSVAAVLRVWNAEPAVTVVMEFDNGKCGILPALAGYIGHAVYEGEGLANASFVPSSNHERYHRYLRRKNNIDRLRAMVSMAVTQNAFKLASEQQAKALANIIRKGKDIDPTLGLYAAHAYSQAGNDKMVSEILSIMHYDLHADLFDVQLLASRVSKPEFSTRIVPFCPILTQSWNLLRPRGKKVHPVLNDAMRHLCNSLWTTFQPKATASIFDAIKTGELR